MKCELRNVLFIFFVVLALLLTGVPPSFSQTLRFAQISDIHYASVNSDKEYKLSDNSGPVLEDAIDRINAQKNIDFVVATGDVIDKPKKSYIYDAINILNKLKYPWYYVQGNHDTSPGLYVNKQSIIEILKKKNKNHVFDSTYYTFKPKKGFRIIVLDAAIGAGISSNGFFPNKELNWLDGVLHKSRKDTVLIFMHFPVVEPFYSPSRRILNLEEFKKILEKYNMPIAVFSGHYHSTKITKRGNILYVSTPSLINYPNAFRIVTVENKKKHVEFKLDFFETRLKDFQLKTKILSFGGVLYYGKPSDRNAVIIIDKKR